jgi:hypothetical protein
VVIQFRNEFVLELDHHLLLAAGRNQAACSPSTQLSSASRFIQPVDLLCFGQGGKTAPDVITISHPQQLLKYIPN